MKKILALIALFTLPLIALASDDTGKTAEASAVTATSASSVSISARGSDVRNVVHDLFTSVKKNYVLDPSVKFELYLSLDKVEFDEALAIVCKSAGLKSEIQNGIYFINKTAVSGSTGQAAQPIEKPVSKKLPEAVLARLVTVKLPKAALKAVFNEFARQTGVPFEIDDSVPAYKLDAFLERQSLRYALDQITKAASLTYKFTEEGTIKIVTTSSENNRIVIAKPDGK